MSNDVFYGADSELRIGIRADKTTAPTAWFNVEFNRLTLNGTNGDRVRRPRLGAARQNKLDPLKPRLGVKRATPWDITVDGDILMMGRWLRLGLGAPTTTGAGPYTHTWYSGPKTEIYFDIAVRIGDGLVHWLKACSLGALSTEWGGENSQDFDIQMTGMAIDSSDAESDWPSGTVTTVTTPAPILKASILINGTAADQAPAGGFTFDRNLIADYYAADGAPSNLASYLRPGAEPAHSGRVTIRALAATLRGYASAATEFSAETRYNGVTSGHRLAFLHPQANMNDVPNDIGTAVIERSFSWTGHQDSDTAALSIVLINSVSSYA